MAGEVLRVIAGSAQGTEIELGDEFVIGRAEPGQSNFGGDPELSRRHARISRALDGSFTLEDLGSTNGTYLNGWRIPSPQALNDKDRIQVGTSVVELSLPAGNLGATLARRRPVILAEARGAEDLRPPERESLLYATDVRKSYGDHEVLKGIDLEVQPGEIVGLLGANGAGKTTFVSIVAGLRPASGGTIRVAGVDALAHPQEARKHLGIAPQDLGIYPTQSVRRNLLFLGELSGLSGKLLGERVEEIGEALSLTPIFDRPAGVLSGGQKRRLHTGMAMLHHPALLILDEPTVGADVRTRQEILDVVKKLAAEGRAICYSTHYMPEIEDLGASVAILKGGQIIARGSIAELISKHSSPAVELRFDGPPPELRLTGEVTREDATLRVKTRDPSTVAGDAIAQLGTDRARLRDIEIIRPSLESVYLSLTAERYSADRDDEAARAALEPAPAVPAAAA